MAKLGVARHRRPNACIACELNAAVEPGLESNFAALGDRFESPEMLACARVVAAHVALNIRLRAWTHADLVGGSDYYDVIHYKGRCR